MPNYVECPICRQRTFKYYEELPKNRLILQYLEIHSTPKTPTPITITIPNNSNINAVGTDMLLHRQMSSSLSSFSVRPTQQEETETKQFIQTVVKDAAATSTLASFVQPSAPQRTPSPSPTCVSINPVGWDNKKYLRSIFDTIDRNKDDGISFDELRQTLRQGGNAMQHAYFSVSKISELFKKYDKNRDGTLSFDEFVELYLEINEKYTEMEMKEMDDGGDERIQVDEYWYVKMYSI